MNFHFPLDEFRLKKKEETHLWTNVERSPGGHGSGPPDPNTPSSNSSSGSRSTVPPPAPTIPPSVDRNPSAIERTISLRFFSSRTKG